MELVKFNNRVINLDSVAYVVFLGTDAHIYFNFDGSGSHLILADEEAEEFRLFVEGTLALG
jgi:hypothetical protein